MNGTDIDTSDTVGVAIGGTIRVGHGSIIAAQASGGVARSHPSGT